MDTITRWRMDSDSQPQKFFAGEFRHAIDEKNRITIPSAGAGTRARISLFCPNRTISFSWSCRRRSLPASSAQAESDSTISARDRRTFSRQLHARAEHGASDRQGRLVLPEDFCKELA